MESDGRIRVSENLEQGRWGAPSEPLTFEVPESQILVLKLHGSVGWHRTHEDRFYFEERYGFLRYLDYRHEGVTIPLTDPEPVPIGPPEGFLLGYPSFLKQLRGAGDAVNLVSSGQGFGQSAIGGDLGI